MYDVAVIGSGMGGALFAALNHKEHELILFEKEPNLGGCASTFKRYNGYYNAGATTFMGYEEGHIIKEIFDKVGYTPDLVKTSSGVRIVQDDIQIDRIKDFDAFLKQLNETYPNPNNERFWRRLKEIDEAFWNLQKFHYAKHSTRAYVKSLNSVAELLKVFKKDLFVSASRFIKKTLGEISPEYQAFIDAQLLITLQSTSKELSLLPMALGLSYTFHDTFYVNGGMGTLIDNLLKEVNVHSNEPIDAIEKKDGFYELTSNKQRYQAKNVVLNSTIYDSSNFFKNQKIIDYYQNFHFSDQSAFVLYLRLDSKETFLHHYQIILKKNLPNGISNAFFVSFSDANDTKMTNQGYSVTISTHTRASLWRNLPKEEYTLKKKETEAIILKEFLNYFSNIQHKEIKRCFSATSKTFQHYIRRENCGGEAVKVKNLLKIPTCTTPFKGLYNIGDTVFAGQGWAGVALGVDVLHKEFNGQRQT